MVAIIQRWKVKFRMRRLKLQIIKLKIHHGVAHFQGCGEEKTQMTVVAREAPLNHRSCKSNSSCKCR